MKKVFSLLLCLIAIVIIRTMMIDGKMYNDEQGLHHVYFTEPRAGEGPKYLGERIFKNGQIILDTYKND